MTANSVTNLDTSGVLRGLAKVAPVEASALEIQRFDQTYSTKVAQLATEVTQAQPPAAIQRPDASQATESATSVDARDRARRALELAPATRPDVAGDKILDGLQSIRNIVDARKTAVTKFSASPDMDIQRFMAMQLEVTEYCLVIDTTSKLIGKSAQTFDTLLKSQ